MYIYIYIYLYNLREFALCILTSSGKHARLSGFVRGFLKPDPADPLAFLNLRSPSRLLALSTSPKMSQNAVFYKERRIPESSGK